MVTRRLTHFARDLQTRLERLFDAPLDAAATPLEISAAIVDAIERKLQPVGRGRRVFPYTRITARIAPLQGDRAGLDAAFAGLDGRVRERLREVGCDGPAAPEVRVVLLRKTPPGWADGQLFAVEYHAPAEGAAEGAACPSMNITVVKGAAARKVYTFADAVISIGRTPDPAGQAGGIRRNRVAFLDTVDGITETVGRAHAQLRYDARAREYRLFDEGSRNGTAIVRDGAAIAVPPRDPRGVRVLSGDEVQVGRAVLRVVIGGGTRA